MGIVPETNTSANVDSTASPAEMFAKVNEVMESRCIGCHAKSPTQPGFSAPPKGVMLENAEDIVRQAQLIHQQVVVTKAVPIGNLTQITDEERVLIDQWYLAGAKSE